MARIDNGASPFSPLTLSQEDAAYLKDLVDVFVGHHVKSFEQYSREDGEHLDNERWKLVMQKDNIRVFSELASTSASDSQERLSSSNEAPVLLAVGFLEGALDDVMYGLLTPTVEAMRLKYFYAEDKLAHGAILDTIEMPTTDNPFQSLTVKWVEGYQAPVVRSIVKNRDFVYMEATGFTKLSDGEVAGYHLLHSVHFPQTSEVRGNIRGTLSVCALYRQRNFSTVEAFVKTTLNPGGTVPRGLAIKYAAVALMRVRKYVRCAHLKKLSWLLRLRDPGPNSTVLRGEPKCIGCGHKPGFFANGIGACSLCRRALCTSCRIKTELGFVGPTGFARRKLWFCSYCLEEAARTSAGTVSCSEYTDSRVTVPTPWSSGPTSTSSPSNSDRSDDWDTMEAKHYRNILP